MCVSPVAHADVCFVYTCTFAPIILHNNTECIPLVLEGTISDCTLENGNVDLTNTYPMIPALYTACMMDSKINHTTILSILIVDKALSKMDPE